MSSENNPHEVADEFIIKDLDTLKKLTHPQRVEILHALRNPKTVKSIAAEIEADPTKLYYHIRQMEQIGAIQVVETNIVSGIVEKKYLVTAKSYQVEDGLFSGEEPIDSKIEFPKMLESVFTSTVRHAQRSARAGLIDMNTGRDGKRISLALTSQILRLDESKLKEFSGRLQEIMDEFGQDPEEESEANNTASDEASSKDYLFTLTYFQLSPEDQ